MSARIPILSKYPGINSRNALGSAQDDANDTPRRHSSFKRHVPALITALGIQQPGVTVERPSSTPSRMSDTRSPHADGIRKLRRKTVQPSKTTTARLWRFSSQWWYRSISNTSTRTHTPQEAIGSKVRVPTDVRVVVHTPPSATVHGLCRLRPSLTHALKKIEDGNNVFDEAARPGWPVVHWGVDVDELRGRDHCLV
ncbi:uncharacterized protein LY79DRAFT_584737 [Colletotrichum navitas]|uniref:Uncharacterized protein n=1 Tax=Colletotrichum navitas TaxID=681940 RepID=A0AAD8PLE2_9PEZI|nr:uncharacterized protein LY79DRAFT_584737 [Colletotrichum navitas]KAK1569412.1 hypothetical protein LY79DRAFT_584737 [Colletotrichum navitas]